MNISTTKTELQKAFSKLIKTSQTKTQTPLINYTYISAGAHGVILHSTDMEVGIKTTITASVNTEGEGLFPTSEVNDIISVIDEGRIDVGFRIARNTDDSEDISQLLQESREKFDTALNDDLNTPLGLSIFFNMIKNINSLAAEEKITKSISEKTMPVLEYMLDVLGIKIQTVSDEEIKSIFDLIKKRESLREQKQFEDADKIRDEIASRGISLIDHKNKTLWMKKEAIKAEKQN